LFNAKILYTYTVSLLSESKFFKRNIFVLLLIAISLFICYKNYTPGTFLTGWDTLHPEFNLGLYWDRVVGGVWQEHQGLGAVASQAHASELVRFPLLLLFKALFGLSGVRYAYAFLMLLAGPLGVYFLLKNTFFVGSKGNSANFGAFLGGLFYLLNLGTLQHFHVPLEMFLTHFGILPWAFLAAIQYLRKNTRSNLLSFSLISLFLSSQAHTPTLFYAYFMAIIVFFGTILIRDLISKNPARSAKRVVMIVLVTLFTNAFWFLPSLYFTVFHGSEISQSKIHHLFSEEAHLSNEKFGSVKDVMILKNFLFDWGEHVGDLKFGELLDEWNVHLSSSGVVLLGYAFFVLVALGMVLSVKKRNYYALPFGAVFLLSVFFLLNTNPPFGFIFKFFQDTIPLFAEAFRFPFTKFSILLAFTYSIFFGAFFAYLFNSIQEWFGKPLIRNIAIFTIITLTVVSLVHYMKPVFTGHLISSSMRVDTPDRYFDMFSYFDSQHEYGRVADFPVHSFWGWSYYDWDSDTHLGYQGAGFLWFGIKQPLLNREFDRWNLLNEQYYREMSYAVYSEDTELFESVLEKYSVRWLILDDSIVVPEEDQDKLFSSQLKELFESSTRVVLDKDFGSGLSVYKYTPKEEFSLIREIEDFAVVKGSFLREPLDTQFGTFGTYITDLSGTGIDFPYLGINEFNERVADRFITSDSEKVTLMLPGEGTFPAVRGDVVEKLPFTVSAKRSGSALDLEFSADTFDSPLIRETNLPLNTGNILQVGDSLFGLENVASDVYSKLGSVEIFPNTQVEVIVYGESEKAAVPIRGLTLEKCSETGAGASYSVEKLPTGFILSAKNVKACVTAELESLYSSSLSSGTVFKINSSVVEGSDVCVLNELTGLCVNDKVSGDDYAFISEAPDSYSLRFYLDARASEATESIRYGGLSVLELTKVAGTSFSWDLESVENPVLSSVLEFPKSAQMSGSAGDFPHDSSKCAPGEVVKHSDLSSVTEEQGTLSFNAVDSSLCASFYFPKAQHNTGYILELWGKNVGGTPLRVCLTNEYSKRCDMYFALPGDSETKTNFYTVPPMGKGVGYTLNISSLVLGDTSSVNELEYVGMTPFPYNTVKSSYTGELGDSGRVQGKLLVHSEAYERGWVVLCGTQLCSAQHVKVNNWANGWVFEEGTTPEVLEEVRVVFWPQVLEYVGLFLAAAALVTPVFIRKKSPKVTPDVSSL
jgi:hypothetical protein